MARTPLFSLMQRALRRSRPSRPFDPERRRVLLGSAGAALALPLAGAGCSSAPTQVSVAIVGGGMAGLHCAYRLKQRGLLASVFEAAPRLGGRVFSDRTTFWQPSGQHCELGGELIDSGHVTMRDLATELGLPLLDYQQDDPTLATDTAFFGGQQVPTADLLAGFAPIAAAIDDAWAAATDRNALPSYTDANGLGAYDQLSLSDFLDRIGASGPARQLVEVAFVVEYGLDASEQSALNLITLISTDTQQLQLFGDSDKRFHCAVGNDAFPSKLAAALDPMQIALEHRLVSLAALPDGRYRLSFDRPSGTKDFVADRVVLALPFTLLRQVDLGVDLPAVKRKAIDELGYGTNTKLMVGFSARPWRQRGSNGSSYTDLGYQNTWETSRLQPGPDGILTNYTGGAHGVAITDGTPEKQRDAFLPQIDQVFPGTAGASTGAVARFAWPTYPLTQGSYACYKVGQWTSIGGAEFEPVGNLHFCGEHTSRDAQGFMEGAALTGAMVAEAIGADLGLGMGAAALSVPARRIGERARLALATGSWKQALLRRRMAR
jgi:monoamine oxidase